MPCTSLPSTIAKATSITLCNSLYQASLRIPVAACATKPDEGPNDGNYHKNSASFLFPCLTSHCISHKGLCLTALAILHPSYEAMSHCVGHAKACHFTKAFEPSFSTSSHPLSTCSVPSGPMITSDGRPPRRSTVGNLGCSFPPKHP